MMVAIGDFPTGQLVAGDVILTPVMGPRGPVGPQGDKGEMGPPGPAKEFPALWMGQGAPPSVLPGAKPGDTWLDTTTGDLYELT